MVKWYNRCTRYALNYGHLLLTRLVGASYCRIGFLYGKYVEDKDSKDKSDKRMKVR
jgi:hypothetical protein